MLRHLTSTAHRRLPSLNNLSRSSETITARDLCLDNGVHSATQGGTSKQGHFQHAGSGRRLAFAAEAGSPAGGETNPDPTPSVSRHIRSRGPPVIVDLSAINDRGLRETVDLALYTKVVMGDAAHSKDMPSFVEYAVTATNTKLKSRYEGEKATRVPNTLKEAMELPQAAGWKVATVKPEATQRIHACSAIDNSPRLEDHRV